MYHVCEHSSLYCTFSTGWTFKVAPVTLSFLFFRIHIVIAPFAFLLLSQPAVFFFVIVNQNLKHQFCWRTITEILYNSFFRMASAQTFTHILSHRWLKPTHCISCKTSVSQCLYQDAYWTWNHCPWHVSRFLRNADVWLCFMFAVGHNHKKHVI